MENTAHSGQKPFNLHGHPQMNIVYTIEAAKEIGGVSKLLAAVVVIETMKVVFKREIPLPDIRTLGVHLDEFEAGAMCKLTTPPKPVYPKGYDNLSESMKRMLEDQF